MKQNNNIDDNIIDIISKYIKSYGLHSSLYHNEEIDNNTCRDIAIGIMAIISGK